MKPLKTEELPKEAFRNIRSAAPLRINDIGGWTDTWFSGRGRILNMAVVPGVEVEIAVSDNDKRRPDRVMIHAVNYGESFRFTPEDPDYGSHPLLQGAVNSIPPPRESSLEITIRSAVPAGISTGTSASACVALLGALDRLSPERRPPEEIARLAHEVET